MNLFRKCIFPKKNHMCTHASSAFEVQCVVKCFAGSLLQTRCARIVKALLHIQVSMNIGWEISAEQNHMYIDHPVCIPASPKHATPDIDSKHMCSTLWIDFTYSNMHKNVQIAEIFIHRVANTSPTMPNYRLWAMSQCQPTTLFYDSMMESLLQALARPELFRVIITADLALWFLTGL